MGKKGEIPPSLVDCCLMFCSKGGSITSFVGESFFFFFLSPKELTEVVCGGP